MVESTWSTIAVARAKHAAREAVARPTRAQIAHAHSVISQNLTSGMGTPWIPPVTETTNRAPGEWKLTGVILTLSRAALRHVNDFLVLLGLGLAYLLQEPGPPGSVPRRSHS